ncbi:potassium channel family protein [Streptomyces chartreusis]|uniref:potassium channel family protein n=1 Tax=Streptomyces chartreusis TaxID=1969 RepID=UPI003627FE37
MDDDSLYANWEQRTEIPLFLASLLFLGAYALQVLAVDMPSTWRDLCAYTMITLWALFAADYVVRWRLSGQGLPRFIRTHFLHSVVVVLPLLRPLRIVPLYDVVQRRQDKPRLSLHARVIAYASLSTVLLGFAGSLAIYQHERGAPGSTIRTFGDSLWCTAATLSTVGYGDVAPVTGGGRIIATGMMMGGLALLGAVTGSFSSWLLQTFARGSDERPPES